jgi:hypothetical protein
MTREKAIAEAAKAIGVTKTWYARYKVTTRDEIDDEIEAPDLDTAIRLMFQLAREDLYRRNGDQGIEGDEICFLTEESERMEEIEFDCREQGEPFSWDAVRIVKQLAVAETDEERQRLVVEARKACTVPTVTQQITEALRGERDA